VNASDTSKTCKLNVCLIKDRHSARVSNKLRSTNRIGIKYLIILGFFKKETQVKI